MSKRILIIDPDIAFTISLKRAMEETQLYEVRTVTRITPAESAVQEAPFDLLVVDMNLDLATPDEAIRAIRALQPDLPVIVTSMRPDDAKERDYLGAQAFLKKRYIARDLIPLADKVIAEGYSAFTAETRANPALVMDEMFNNEVREVIDPMWEASRRNQALMDQEPPITNYDSTISEVIDAAMEPETSQRIYTLIDGEPLPDEPTDLLMPPIYIDDDEPPAAKTALDFTQNIPALDNLLDEIRHFAARRNDEEIPLEPKSLSEVMATMAPPPDLPEMGRAPVEDDTAPSQFSRPPRLPDEDFLDVLAKPVLLPIDDDVDDPLLQTPLDQITQQLEIQAEEEVVVEQNLTIPIPVLQHYAAQLTQFALESAAVGTLLTEGTGILGRAGELSIEGWEQVRDVLDDAWSRGGNAKTRVIYRRLPIGEVLLYSIHTLDDLTLTLIFRADTSIKNIRRQAERLIEALRESPPQLPEEILAEPTEIIQVEPPPPPNLDYREGVELGETAEIEAQREAITPTVERLPGDYVEYGCVWLLNEQQPPLEDDTRDSLNLWIGEICAANHWEFKDSHIASRWLAVWLHVPEKELPNAVASILMDESAQRFSRNGARVWSEGYLIVTPGEKLTESEIDRFMQFHQQEYHA